MIKDDLRVFLIISCVLLVGLFVGQKVDSFLFISITDKPFHKTVADTDIKEHQVLPFRMVDLGRVC